MKKRTSRVLKRVGVGVLIVFGVLVLAVASVFFVYGDDAPEVLNVFVPGVGENGGVVYTDDGGEVIYDDEVVASVGGGGSSGGGSGGGDSGGTPFVCSEWQQVQYSLSDFDENIECLVYGVGGCEKVRFECSSRLYNLDYELGGEFGMRFSVFSGNEEISYDIIEESLEPRTGSVLRSEIVLDGVFDVGSLECVVSADHVLSRCLY